MLQHTFGNLKYYYDDEAYFALVRWTARQFFGGTHDETKEMLKFWKISMGDTVFDIGAHIGSWTLPALAMGAKHVYAFEPQESSVETLRINLTLNGWQDNCTVTQCALWNKTGENLPFYWPITVPASEETKKWLLSRSEGDVNTLRLDDWVEERKDIEKIDWMKIDVDGSEIHVLDGAQETLKKFKPKILIQKHQEIIESIWGHDVELRDHLPNIIDEIKMDSGNSIFTLK